MSLETLNWGSVADWASAFGSVAAVITALYLASTSQRIKLNAWCGHRVVAGGGIPNESLISIMVTNIGGRPATISNIGIKVGLFKKRYAIIKCTPAEYCAGVPKLINDGEQALYGFPLDNERTWAVAGAECNTVIELKLEHHAA